MLPCITVKIIEEDILMVGRGLQFVPACADNWREEWSRQVCVELSAGYLYLYSILTSLQGTLFTYYCNARGFVLINKFFIYLFSNFCHNKSNIQ